VRFDREKVTSIDWMSYPILRFATRPKLRGWCDQPSVRSRHGGGEPSIRVVIPGRWRTLLRRDRVRLAARAAHATSASRPRFRARLSSGREEGQMNPLFAVP